MSLPSPPKFSEYDDSFQTVGTGDAVLVLGRDFTEQGNGDQPLL